MTLIAVLSDTHGLLRPEILPLLQQRQPSHILHAGDVCSATILPELATVAPVTVVRGNCDYGPTGELLPDTAVLEVGNASIFMLHDLNHLDLIPHAAGFQVVVSGHTHQPKISYGLGDVLYLNPGSIGRRRFDYPISFAWLSITNDGIQAELEYLA